MVLPVSPSGPGQVRLRGAAGGGVVADQVRRPLLSYRGSRRRASPLWCCLLSGGPAWGRAMTVVDRFSDHVLQGTAEDSGVGPVAGAVGVGSPVDVALVPQRPFEAGEPCAAAAVRVRCERRVEVGDRCPAVGGCGVAPGGGADGPVEKLAEARDLLSL